MYSSLKTSSILQGFPKYRSNLVGNAAYNPDAHVLIASQTVGAGGAASVTFSSIPSTYKHLQIRGIAKWDSTSADWRATQVTLNGDTGSNYTAHLLAGNGSTASSGGNTSRANMYWVGQLPGYSAQIFGALIADITDYASGTKYKTLRCLSGFDTNGSGEVDLTSGLWMNTNAVTSITLTPSGGNYGQFSTFALYGIKG